MLTRHGDVVLASGAIQYWTQVYVAAWLKGQGPGEGLTLKVRRWVQPARVLRCERGE